MYCPRCAKRADPDTSYCRTCGLSLDDARKIVSGEASTEPEFKRRPNFKLMQIGISIFILGMVVALANAALSTAIGFNKDIGKAIFLAIIAVGMLFLGLGFIFPQKHYTKRRTKAPLAEDETEPDRMTSSLNNVLANGQESAHEIEFPKDEREPIHAEIPSVTEHTTSQLN